MVDLIFVGGGLASCLTAYRLKQVQPGLRTLVLESGPTLGGNHTWSFFPTDLTETQHRWIEPLVRHRWSCYEVRFPGLRRKFQTGYCSTDSAHFHDVMTAELDDRIKLNADVIDLSTKGVLLSSGETYAAPCVIDGRGPAPSEHLTLGFQKFTGQVLRLENAHGLDGPITMDATIVQDGDYRFVYTLPLSEREVMVEDTRYSNTPDIRPDVDAAAIRAYAEQQGWQVTEVIREEHGSLPITLGGDIDGFWSEAGPIPRIGLRAALFHATTGYSFADGVRTADAIAATDISTTERMREFLSHRSKTHWNAQAYWRLLNRMLFIAAKPDRRWFIMQRFYKLRSPLIERFYGGRSTFLDKVRILTGKPPVAILRALRCLPESSAATLI